jgi:predicted MFS family arabinose efflux permease
MSVESIGSLFSLAQLVQVFVILLAPAILRRTGQLNGITTMQFGTAIMLCSLAFVANPFLAAVIYVSYMCLQYMSEPCLLSILMTGVEKAEQSGASALHFMTIALAGILAAMAAGAMFSRSGYGPTLILCAVVTGIAAVLFYRLVPIPKSDGSAK